MSIFNKLSNLLSKKQQMTTDIKTFGRRIEEKRNELMRCREAIEVTNLAYQERLDKIESLWSTLYNQQTYNTKQGKKLEKLCFESIELYQKMVALGEKHHRTDRTSLTHVQAVKRLAMLYERQGNYEKSVDICKMSILKNIPVHDADSRMLSMIKKAGREPTEEEMKLLPSQPNKTKSEKN